MNRRHRGRKPRLITTAAGDVRLARLYLECPRCLEGGYPLDQRLGIDGRYSRQAQRLISLAAGSWSYDISSERLEELCGLKVSSTTIRDVSQKHGAAANAFLREEPAAVREFRETSGDVEFTTDGTSVHTTEGWREMKVGLFSKRDRGKPADPWEWADRSLPAPKVRIAFAAIEDCEQFGDRWKAWRKRLGLADLSGVTLLADGAKWIWEQQRQRLPGAEGVLDVFHVLEHLSQASQSLHADPQAAGAWLEAGRTTLLTEGWSGLDRFFEEGREERSAEGEEAVDRLRGYLAEHDAHLNYAERLASGQSIGSGQVEGACKNLIGRRLKQTGARWRVRRVNRMAGLCCLLYSGQWANYWQTP